MRPRIAISVVAAVSAAMIEASLQHLQAARLPPQSYARSITTISP